MRPGSLASTTEADWDRHFAINLKAPAFLCREFAARHPAGQPAAIVNIADWRGLRPVPGSFLLHADKSGPHRHDAKFLALELAPDIRVNAVAPGAILPPARGECRLSRTAGTRSAAQRHGTPDDIANAVLYLIRSDFVTGEILRVTGGEDLL